MPGGWVCRVEEGPAPEGYRPGGAPTRAGEGWCEFAGLHADKTLPRKPSVPRLIPVLLNSGQGGGPSAKVGTDKTFSLCRKLASEGRL